jgi:hypothetical protein
VNVDIKKENGITLIKLSGAIDETTDFDQQLGKLEGKLEINCREIDRINSTGIKSWIRYFQSGQYEIIFKECSISIIEQINLISNFLVGAVVESLFAPFVCKSCHKELLVLFRVENLKESGFSMPAVKCVQCQGEAVFDDVEEDYFSFLMQEK